MRLAALALMCVATMGVVCRCANAQQPEQLDAVDLLFHDAPAATPAPSGLPSIAGDEPVTTIDFDQAAGAAPTTANKEAPRAVAGPTLWEAAGSDEGVGAHVSGDAAGNHAATEPAATVNAVPEPSAILLALAALAYFLLFGRRRMA